MSRRCKPGQRARVKPTGQILLVVGHYFEGMAWGGETRWKIYFFPWKVLSLAGPFDIFASRTKVFLRTSMYCVFDDADLEPLDDDDDGLTRPPRRTSRRQ